MPAQLRVTPFDSPHARPSLLADSSTYTFTHPSVDDGQSVQVAQLDAPAMDEDEVIDEGAARSVILQDDQTRRGGGFALAQNEHTADDDEGGAAAVDVSGGCRDSVAVDEVPANEDEFEHSSQKRWTLGSSNKFTLEGVLAQTEPGSVPERAPYSVDVCGLEESEKVGIHSLSDSQAPMLVIMESRNGKTGAWKNVWWAAAVLRKRGVPLDVTVVSDVQNVDGERLLEIEISLEGWILTDGALCLPQGTVAPSKRDFEIAAEAALVLFSRIREGGDVAEACTGAALKDLYNAIPAPEAVVQHPGYSQPDPNCLILHCCSNEILLSIFRFLLATPLRKLAQVCHRFHALLRTPTPFGLHLVPGMCLPKLKHRVEGSGNIELDQRPSLKPHQTNAVIRMMSMEKPTRVPDAFTFVGIKGCADDDGTECTLHLSRLDFRIQDCTPPDCIFGGGGLQADEPGFGKTITAIALIIATAGVFSQPPPTIEAARTQEQCAAAKVWTDLDSTSRRTYIVMYVKAMYAAIHNAGNHGEFFAESVADSIIDERIEAAAPPGSLSNTVGLQDVLRFGESLAELRSVSSEDAANPSLDGMTRRVFQSWITLDSSLAVHKAMDTATADLLAQLSATAKAVLPQIDDIIGSIERLLINRSGGGLAQAATFLGRTGPCSSCATLIIVPHQLVDQWKLQVLKATRGGTIWVDDDPPGDATPLEGGWGLQQKREAFFDSFDSRGALLPLPPATVLAARWIVVISSKRLAVAALDPDSPLLAVHWVRTFVDEGDTLASKSCTRDNLTSIKTGANWTITGTPTPDKEGKSGLGELQGLLPYIGRVGPFDRENDPGGRLFLALVREPFKNRRHDAMMAVLRLLSLIMIRAQTKTLRWMFSPKEETREVTLGPTERHAYNSVLAMYKANTLLAMMAMEEHRIDAERLGTVYDEKKDSAWLNSYLNPGNFVVKSLTSNVNTGSGDIFKKLQMAAVGGDEVHTSVHPEDMAETERFLNVSWSVPDFRTPDSPLKDPEFDMRVNRAIRMILSERLHGFLVDIASDIRVYVRPTRVDSSATQRFAVYSLLATFDEERAVEVQCDWHNGRTFGAYVLADKTGKHEGQLCCEDCYADTPLRSHVFSYFADRCFATLIQGSAATRKQAFATRTSRAKCFEAIAGRQCGEAANVGHGLCQHHLRSQANHASLCGTSGPAPTKRATRYMQGAPDVCDSCGKTLPGMCMAGCGHMFCTECVAPTSRVCPVANCGVAIDAEHFTYLQPSFKLEFTVDDRCSLCKVDFATFPYTKNAKGRSTIDLSKCSLEQKQQFKKHRACRWWADGTEQHTHAKLAHLVADLNRLRKTTPKFKAIVFSQSSRVLEAVGDKILRSMGAVLLKEKQSRPSYDSGGRLLPASAVTLTDDEYYAPMADQRAGVAEQTAVGEVRRFRNDADCHVLIMTTDRIKGFDFSFVSHMYVLDEIFDTSKMTQLVHRAYRMGADGPATIIRLVAKGTIDEVLNTVNKEEILRRKASMAQTQFGEEAKKAKTLRILQRLKFV